MHSKFVLKIWFLGIDIWAIYMFVLPKIMCLGTASHNKIQGVDESKIYNTVLAIMFVNLLSFDINLLFWWLLLLFLSSCFYFWTQGFLYNLG